MVLNKGLQIDREELRSLILWEGGQPHSTLGGGSGSGLKIDITHHVESILVI